MKILPTSPILALAIFLASHGSLQAATTMPFLSAGHTVKTPVGIHSAVPEPSISILSLLAAFVLISRRGRRRY